MSKLALRAVNKLSQFSLGHFIDPEQARSFLQKCYFEWFTQQSVVRCDADKTQKTRQRLCEAVQKPKESCLSLDRKEAVLRHFQHQSYRRCEKWQHSDEHVTTVSSEDVHTTLRLQLCAYSTCCVVSNIAKPQPWQHPKKKRTTACCQENYLRLRTWGIQRCCLLNNTHLSVSCSGTARQAGRFQGTPTRKVSGFKRIEGKRKTRRPFLPAHAPDWPPLMQSVIPRTS